MQAEVENDAINAAVYEGEGEDSGLVGLVFENAPCIFAGSIASGICMTPQQARFLAGALIAAAVHIEGQ